MERNVPRPHASIRTSTGQLRRAQPEHGVDATRRSVLDCYTAQREFHAGDVHMGVERARRDILAVRCPRQRKDAPAVESPSSSDQLYVMRDLLTRPIYGDVQKLFAVPSSPSRHIARFSPLPDHKVNYLIPL